MCHLWDGRHSSERSFEQLLSDITSGRNDDAAVAALQRRVLDAVRRLAERGKADDQAAALARLALGHIHKRSSDADATESQPESQPVHRR